MRRRLIEESSSGTIESRGVGEEDGRRSDFNFESPSINP